MNRKSEDGKDTNTWRGYNRLYTNINIYIVLENRKRGKVYIEVIKEKIRLKERIEREVNTNLGGKRQENGNERKAGKMERRRDLYKRISINNSARSCENRF